MKQSRKEIQARYREKNREKLRQHAAIYRKENIDKIRDAEKRSKAKKKNILVESLGGCCCSCGCKSNLEFDHINPALKTMMPSTMVGLAEDNPKRIEELKNIQLLCKKCHRNKTNKQLEMAWSILRALPLELQERWLETPPTSLEEIIQSLLQYHQ